jgi:hypothetical protein
MWRDLLQQGEAIVSPWLGGRSLRTFERAWRIHGRLPPEPGWHEFDVSGRQARWRRAAEPTPQLLRERVRGYLIGDRLVPDTVRVRPELDALVHRFQRVFLVEPGIERFARVVAGRFTDDGPLVFDGLDLPLGPEADVAMALLDGRESLDGVRFVPPALDAAFRVEIWRRREAERRRREAAEAVRAERTRLELERRRRQLREQLGDARLRRELAAVDFEAAARAALALGGAEYVDHRRAYRQGEMNVSFRLDGGHFVCTCEERTLRIIDAGVCLTDHDTGETGDTLFTIESLPGVIRQADRDGVLVVFRHFA